jgi:hypothetical protein
MVKSEIASRTIAIDLSITPNLLGLRVLIISVVSPGFGTDSERCGSNPLRLAKGSDPFHCPEVVTPGIVARDEESEASQGERTWTKGLEGVLEVQTLPEASALASPTFLLLLQRTLDRWLQSWDVAMDNFKGAT